MAEFCYYGTLNDCKDIINHILKNTDLYLIPELNYKEKKIVLVRIMNDYIKALINKNGSFYLWSKKLYPVFPLDYWECKEGELKGTYHIKESPSLNITTSGFIDNKEGSRLRSVCGMLTYSKELYNKRKDEVIPIQNSVLEEHKRVVKIMKEKLIKVKNKSLWIGKEAYDLFMKGELEVIYNGKWITNS